MTKESLALQIIKDHGCADFGNVSITPEQIEKYLGEFAEQQAIAFLKELFKNGNITLTEQDELVLCHPRNGLFGLNEVGFHETADILYSQFYDNQFIEQQNK